jgi:hypothetical protein
VEALDIIGVSGRRYGADISSIVPLGGPETRVTGFVVVEDCLCEDTDAFPSFSTKRGSSVGEGDSVAGTNSRGHPVLRGAGAGHSPSPRPRALPLMDGVGVDLS